jgi:hypothetical protein
MSIAAGYRDADHHGASGGYQIMNRILMLGGLALMSLGALVWGTNSAIAHEHREVGEYAFVVGFLNEPALLNEPNSLDLRVEHHDDETPVEGLEETLNVTVSAQGQELELELEGRWGTPGAYNAYFMPTAAGEYTFHITGMVEDFQVDETFTSGPDTFSTVDPPIGFPVAYEAGADIASLEERVVTLESDSDSGSDSGTTLGIIGIIVGALGLGVGGLAFMKANKA